MVIKLFNDNFQNYKSYNIPAKAQLVIADIPYNLGKNAYASNPDWYRGGITKTVKVARLAKAFSTATVTSILLSIFTFAANFLRRSRKNATKLRR